VQESGHEITCLESRAPRAGKFQLPEYQRMVMAALDGQFPLRCSLTSEYNVNTQVSLSSLECHSSPMADVHQQVCLCAARVALRNRSNCATWMHRAWNSDCPDATGFRYLVRGYRHDELSHSMVWGLPVILPVPDEALLGAMIESDIVRVAALAWVNSNGHITGGSSITVGAGPTSPHCNVQGPLSRGTGHAVTVLWLLQGCIDIVIIDDIKRYIHFTSPCDHAPSLHCCYRLNQLIYLITRRSIDGAMPTLVILPCRLAALQIAHRCVRLLPGSRYTVRDAWFSLSFPQSATQAVFMHTELNTVGSMSSWICETSRRGTLSAYDATFPWAADPATAIIEMQRSGYGRYSHLPVSCHFDPLVMCLFIWLPVVLCCRVGSYYWSCRSPATELEYRRLVMSGMLTCTGRYRSAWVNRGDAPSGYDRLVSLRLINERLAASTRSTLYPRRGASLWNGINSRAVVDTNVLPPWDADISSWCESQSLAPEVERNDPPHSPSASAAGVVVRSRPKRSRF
jgi:hypothetical protein